ncbi:MAG: hypothetical protein B1H03_06360 [Planctomycetales bacterium 4484_113]|nr:MAG: hypothetical protein B1H03_06360 [Planctomycetales bacterium 4484_113]
MRETLTRPKLEARTLNELQRLARESGLKNYSKLRKADLIELLLSHSAAVASNADAGARKGDAESTEADRPRRRREIGAARS